MLSPSPAVPVHAGDGRGGECGAGRAAAGAPHGICSLGGELPAGAADQAAAQA